MSIRNILLLRGVRNAFSRCFIRRSAFGAIHRSSNVTPPIQISGAKNIFIHEDVAIGADSLMYATHPKIVIKKGFVSAIGLKLITGDMKGASGKCYIPLQI